MQAGQQSPVKLSTFHPKFTYPIFGEEECIFGYQGLNITIRFAAHDLLPNLSVKYDKKFKTVNDTEALNIEETLKEWMPEGESFKNHHARTRGLTMAKSASNHPLSSITESSMTQLPATGSHPENSLNPIKVEVATSRSGVPT